MIIMTICRFPINFKSEVEETSLLSGRKFFYHVVLGIAYKGGQHGGQIDGDDEEDDEDEDASEDNSFSTFTWELLIKVVNMLIIMIMMLSI